MDKADILDTLQGLRREWVELIGELQPHAMTQPGAVGKWSVKDLAAHVTWSERETVGMLRARALVGSELWQRSEEERNAVVYEENRDRPLRDILEDAEGVHRALVAVIEHIPESDLFHADWFAALPGDWPPYRVIEANVTEHYRHHLEDLRRWTKKQ